MSLNRTISRMSADLLSSDESWMLTPEQITTLPTHRLLAAYKAHRNRGRRLGYWADVYGFQSDIARAEAFNEYLASIKAELDTREHIGPNRVTHKTTNWWLRMRVGGRRRNIKGHRRS